MAEPPLQPLYIDNDGYERFRGNKLVELLLDVASRHGCDLNYLATLDVPVEDREQLAMLIGYSLGGFSELSYVRDETFERAALSSPNKNSVLRTMVVVEGVAACLDCGLPYTEFPLDVILPRPQWLEIHPDEQGLLCASCIVKRAAQVPGATCVHAIIEIAPNRGERGPV